MFCSDDRCVVQYVVEFVQIKSNEELVFIQDNGLREIAGRAVYDAFAFALFYYI